MNNKKTVSFFGRFRVQKTKQKQIQMEEEISSIQLITNRFVNGKSYLILYTCLLCLTVLDTILGIMYVLRDKDDFAIATIITMMIVTILVVVEVTLRYLATRDRKMFFQKCVNCLDVTVICFGIVGLVLFIAGFDHRDTLGEDVADIFDNVLLLGRSVYMFIRLFVLMKSNKGKAFRLGNRNDGDIIDFNQVAALDDPIQSSWDGDLDNIEDAISSEDYQRL